MQQDSSRTWRPQRLRASAPDVLAHRRPPLRLRVGGVTERHRGRLYDLDAHDISGKTEVDGPRNRTMRVASRPAWSPVRTLIPSRGDAQQLPSNALPPPGRRRNRKNPSKHSKACCTECKRPSAAPAKPSMVVISFPAAITASVRHDRTGRPATCTVQAPH
jgi:hypothetical protein